MKQLENWKLTMANSTLSADEIEELASHLAERMEVLGQMGLSEPQAWVLAEHELGKPADLKKEYGKLRPLVFSTKRIFAALCVAGLIFTVSSFVLSDSGRCTNTNPVFEKSLPSSMAYKKELAAQISKIGYNNLTFTFKDFKQEGSKTSVLIGLSGDDLCAETWMTVKSWKNLEGIKRNKGMGYSGARLVSPTLEMTSNNNVTDFVLTGVKGVND